MTRSSAIQLLEQQEAMSVLDRFEEGVTRDLGLVLHAAAAPESAPVKVNICSASRRYLYSASLHSHEDNERWARRKGNVAVGCHASSNLVKLRVKAECRSCWPDAVFKTQEWAVQYAGLPARLGTYAVIGCSAVSGFQSHLNRYLIVEVLMELLNAKCVADTPNQLGSL